MRWWMDVEGREKRAHRRARICPTSGKGVLSASARQRRAHEIITESGADTEEYFNKVVKQKNGARFREQASFWIERVNSRKRKPVAIATLQSWEGCLRNWINPTIGDLPLSEVNNAALKGLVAKMSKGGLSAKTIDNYAQVVKTVVASAVNKEGEEVYPRKWNHEFIDRRIGEALGLEIDKHLSSDFMTISINQKVRHCKVEDRVKTASSVRKIDLHPTIAGMLKVFIDGRKAGFLFCSRNGKPVASSNITRRHLHPALKQLGFVNSHTGTHKAGNHAFRRFRNTHLRNRTACPEGLLKFWMGHADESMGDLYDKIKEDVAFRKEWAEKCGFGFNLPSVVPNVPIVPRNGEIDEAEKAA